MFKRISKSSQGLFKEFQGVLVDLSSVSMGTLRVSGSTMTSQRRSGVSQGSIREFQGVPRDLRTVSRGFQGIP